jgi:hypothetical protein
MSTRPILAVPGSHLRLSGLGYPEEALSRGGRAISSALDLVAHDPLFRFSSGHLATIEAYLRSHPERAKDLCEAIGDGRIEVGAGWVPLAQALVDGEVLVRNLALGGAFAGARLAARPVVCHEDGAGGWTPQFPQIALGAGIPLAAFRGPGPGHPSLIGWRGLDGSVLTTWHGGESTRQLGPGLDVTADGSPVYWGDDLWVPDEAALSSLRAWAKEEDLALELVTVSEAVARLGPAAGESIPVGDRPATGPPLEAVLPELFLAGSRAVTSLLEAERAWASLVVMGREALEYPGFQDRWRALLAALSLYRSGAGEQGTVAGCEAVARSVQTASETDIVRIQQSVAEAVTAGYGPAGTIPIVIFNSLAWDRTGPVEAHVTFYGGNAATDSSRYDAYRIVAEDGRPVPSQQLGGRQTTVAEAGLLFVASDVPANGYATYYLVPDVPEAGSFSGIQAPGALAPDFSEPSFVVEDSVDRVSEPYRGIRVGRSLETRHYLLDVDEITGGVSVSDRRLGRDLLAGIRPVAVEESLKAGPDGQAPTGRIFEFSPDRVELEESGEVRATLAVYGRLLSSPIEIRYRLYGDVPRVDVTLKLSWRDPKPVRVQMRFPTCTSSPAVRYGVPFGHVLLDARQDAPGAGSGAEVPGDPEPGRRQFQGWVALDDDGWGMALASDRRTFSVHGSELRNEVLVSCPDPASYGYKVFWRRNPEELVCRYSIRGYTGSFAEGLAHRDAWELDYGLRAVCSYGSPSGRSLPTSGSLLRLDGSGVVTSAMKLSEDGQAVILRAFETLGLPCQASLTGCRPIGSVREADLLEVPGAELDSGCISFRPFEIKTLRVILDAPA